MNIFDRALGNKVPVLKTKKIMHSMSPIHLLGSINVTVCFDNHIYYPHLKKRSGSCDSKKKWKLLFKTLDTLVEVVTSIRRWMDYAP